MARKTHNNMLFYLFTSLRIGRKGSAKKLVLTNIGWPGFIVLNWTVVKLLRIYLFT